MSNAEYFDYNDCYTLSDEELADQEAQLAEEAAEDALLDAGQYDPYGVPEDPLAGSCDPTGGFPR